MTDSLKATETSAGSGSSGATPGYGGAARRLAYAANMALFLLALVTLAVVTMYFANRPGMRVRIDATKTRAYSLSAQSRQLLETLDGSWTIALVMVDDDADAATREQVDEVLSRYEEASDAISIVRVDPTNPATLGEYEVLLGRLRAHEGDLIDAYETHLDAGEAAFDSLRLFAQQQSAQLQRLLELLPESDPARRDIEERLGPLALLGDEGDAVLEQAKTARRVTDAQPIPDYETARSIHVHVHTQWANELDDMARAYADWEQRNDVSAAVARFAANVRAEYEQLARRLATVADPLATLRPLELSSIGRQLAGGEAAVIIGPQRTAVIPSEQLFPTVNRRALGDGAIAFDRRFRGEQVISAAIRSLLVEQMPLVVLVHDQPQSMMRRAPQRPDLLGVGDMLQASRFEVQEWGVGHTERPVPRNGQSVVWVIVPPSQREDLEPGRGERLLIETAERLLSDGESVLVNVYPSLLPRYRRPDPWQDVTAPFGVRPRTAEPIMEAAPGADGTMQYQQAQTLDQFSFDHPIASAVHGQQTAFVLPVALEQVATSNTVRRHVLAAVEPSPFRWLEADWQRTMTADEVGERGDPFADAQPIAMAIEMDRPGAGVQRVIAVGSGGWMLSHVADVYASIDGTRAALAYPGNHELMLASVAWLAGMDALIAPSPLSRQVARLDGIDASTRVRWSLLTILGAPFGCLLVGVGVWLMRR